MAAMNRGHGRTITSLCCSERHQPGRRPGLLRCPRAGRDRLRLLVPARDQGPARGGHRPALRTAPRDRDTHHLPPDSKGINHGTNRHRPRNHRSQRLARAPLARVTAHASRNPRAAGRGVRRPPRLASGRPAGAARLPPRGSPSASSADTGRSATLIAVLMMWSAGSPMKLNPCCRQAQPVQQPTAPSKFTADDRTQQ